MHLSKSVSDKLQSEDLDVVSGCKRVADLLAAIKVLRCEAKFQSFWESTLERCCVLGIAEPKEHRRINFLVELMTIPRMPYKCQQKTI